MIDVRIAELWRYPVKSMAGEQIERASLTPAGVHGDRLVRVEQDGALVTARTAPALLGMRGTTAADEEPLIDGHRWDTAATRTTVSGHLGAEVELVRADPSERFDILPLLVATDGAVEAFGHDGRRLRPNIVLGGVTALDEREWEGRFVTVGDAIIGLHSLRDRCIVTTFDPDTLKQDVAVLRSIGRRFGGKLALNAWVVRPGEIAVGDHATIFSHADMLRRMGRQAA